MRLSVALLFSALAVGQQTGARISAESPLSAAQIQELEAAAGADPANKDARFRLLRHYSTAGEAGRAARISHLLHLIERFPDDPAVGAYAADDPLLREAWLRAAQDDRAIVLLNASRSLRDRYLRDAQELLARAVARDPEHRRGIAAHLGFLLAFDILGMGSPSDPARARDELDRSQVAYVLAGASVALTNLFPRSSAARDSDGRPVFEYAAQLMKRARELAPNQPELSGPMPLIEVFREFQGAETPAVAAAPAPGPPGSVRVARDVQAAKLIDKPEPVYPPLAQQARIQGRVLFTASIGPDGRVDNVTLLSGHPLLVPAATEAVRRYRYEPTLLNGAPIPVVTQVEVLFRLQ